MIMSTCAPSSAFSLISLEFINQFKHDIHQKEAEYISYSKVLSILLLVKKSKIYVIKSTNNLFFFLNSFECE